MKIDTVAFNELAILVAIVNELKYHTWQCIPAVDKLTLLDKLKVHDKWKFS